MTMRANNNRTETTEEAGKGGSPRVDPASAHTGQLRDNQRMDFGICGTLLGTGALVGVLDP
jgi:hypothetical protein